MTPWYKGFLPGWIVSGGGGGGLSSVTTDATLTGAGTAGSPLKVKPSTWFPGDVYQNPSGTVTPNINNTWVWGIFLPTLSAGNISINVITADAVNNTDIGFYNASGILVADIGAQVIGSTGYQNKALAQGTVLFTTGLYFLSFTSAGSTLALASYPNLATTWTRTNTAGVTAGGALAASISVPAKSVLGNDSPPYFSLH